MGTVASCADSYGNHILQEHYHLTSDSLECFQLDFIQLLQYSHWQHLQDCREPSQRDCYFEEDNLLLKKISPAFIFFDLNSQNNLGISRVTGQCSSSLFVHWKSPVGLFKPPLLSTHTRLCDLQCLVFRHEKQPIRLYMGVQYVAMFWNRTKISSWDF